MPGTVGCTFLLFRYALKRRRRSPMLTPWLASSASAAGLSAFDGGTNFDMSSVGMRASSSGVQVSSSS